MIYTEKPCDLFSVSDKYWLAHCISSDFSMGRGIAVEFNKRFNLKSRISEEFDKNIWDKMGCCRIVSDIPVFNLITKEKYWHKPTYQTMHQALENMKNQMIDMNLNEIAVPLIGCGLDKLKWEKVSEIIKDIFRQTDYEILVCCNVQKDKLDNEVKIIE